MSNLARWTAIFDELGLAGDPEVHAELRRRYSETSRSFHTLHHVAECLDLFDQVRDQCEHPQEVELAIWFMAAYRDVRRADNELRSAEWAQQVMQAAGAPADVVEAIYHLVLATAADVELTTPDEALLVDISRSILGARPTRFSAYERQLRSEYRHLPQHLYQGIRKKALRDWLESPRIYRTDWFHQRFEAQARTNLQGALRRWSGGAPMLRAV